MMISDWLQDPSGTTDGEEQPHDDELLDEADDFEEELAVELLRTGAIEVWS